MAQKKTTIIPVGPYHPLQEEPEFFKLYTEGEKVVGLDIELGYNHRGIENESPPNYPCTSNVGGLQCAPAKGSLKRRSVDR